MHFCLGFAACISGTPRKISDKTNQIGCLFCQSAYMSIYPSALCLSALSLEFWCSDYEFPFLPCLHSSVGFEALTWCCSICSSAVFAHLWMCPSANLPISTFALRLLKSLSPEVSPWSPWSPWSLWSKSSVLRSLKSSQASSLKPKAKKSSQEGSPQVKSQVSSLKPRQHYSKSFRSSSFKKPQVLTFL